MCKQDLILQRQEIANYLREHMGFELIEQSSSEVTRIMGKLEIHELPVSPENIQWVLAEYGEEVMNPIKAVIFDEY